MEQLKARIEAVLYLTRRALSAKEIGDILEVDAADVEDALLELIGDYSAREGALEINDEDGYILQVKEDLIDIVEKLCPAEFKPAVLKTLLVIAIKEPIRQTALVELRGSSAYDHIQELLAKGMISKTKDKNGRSFNLKTTNKFSEYFKIKDDIENYFKKGDIKSLLEKLDVGHVDE